MPRTRSKRPTAKRPAAKRPAAKPAAAKPAAAKPAAAKRPTDAALEELRAFGLAYPGAHTKSPWPGHLDLAVKDKTFAYLGVEGEPFQISCKLPRSGAEALMLPFAKPTGYGLGKSGWVSASFPDGQAPPLPLLKAWIDESYRAQAPKKLVASLDAPAAAPAEPRREARPASRSAPAPRKP
jgi:predicted DNA-binding protein (MmcQ/YjbR family)